jgi:hypothetical protein
MRNGHQVTRGWVLAGFAVAALVGCGGDSGGTPSPGPEYDPGVTPAQLSRTIDNPFFPLPAGARWEYEAETDEGRERTLVEVLSKTRTVWGVEATAVRDRVFLDGELIEDTEDWYAQDTEGNVWYLGEEVKNYENGQLVDTAGSWAAGVDGALPGVAMWADPAAHLGQEYRQEFYKGKAEDWGKVVAVNESVSVPAGSFTGCVKTEDWNALEPGPLENKYYCPQAAGLALEVKVPGGSERNELVGREAP